MTDTKFRSLIKALSWRVLALLITFTVAFIITKGNTGKSLIIGIFDSLIKIIFYFMHERIWGRIKLGRLFHPLEDIIFSRNLNQQEKSVIVGKIKEMGYLDD